MTAHHLDIQPARAVRGRLAPPGDKSLSHRYALLGGLAAGVSEIRHLAPGADVAATLACLRRLGADVAPAGDAAVQIVGAGAGGFRRPTGELDAANSGTTLRLLAGLLAGHPFRSTLTGDASLRRRPMRRVIDPLVRMGATIASRDGLAPLVIDGGRLSGVAWRSPVASAQVKSAVLLAGLLADGTTSVEEPLPSRDHTERALPVFGLAVQVDGLRASVTGGQRPRAPASPLEVPGDPSSAAVWAAAAAALPGSAVELSGVCLNPRRIGFVSVLARMGAGVRVEIEAERAGEPVGRIFVEYRGHGDAAVEAAEVPALIDELPVLAARAALGGSLDVRGAAELRVKESDRIAALVTGLRALGVDADERPDGFRVSGAARPRGGTVDAAGDHRLVMAFALVGLGASGPTRILGADSVAVSYPGFARDLAAVTR